MDTIGNMLTSLVNAQRVKKERVLIPYSRVHESLLKLLEARGRIGHVSRKEGTAGKLLVTLKYDDGKPSIRGVRRLSKPGGRHYVGTGGLPYPTHGNAFYVVSTSQGLMDQMRARREKLGGELMCEIW